MKIICDCGEVTELVDDVQGPSYTNYEGWYKVVNGSLEVSGAHDQVFFHCSNCGQEIWFFT